MSAVWRDILGVDNINVCLSLHQKRAIFHGLLNVIIIKY